MKKKLGDQCQNYAHFAGLVYAHYDKMKKKMKIKNMQKIMRSRNSGGSWMEILKIKNKKFQNRY